MGSNQSVIADQDGDFNDWIELHNYSNAPVNLSGYGLSDAVNEPFKWVFPNVTMAPNSFLLVWASGKNLLNPVNDLHTNFSISSGGEEIILTAPNSTTIDIVLAYPFQMDVSIGRQPDGTGPWVYFYDPTPNSANLGLGLDALIAAPIFSHNSGLYTSNFELTLSHPNPNALIVYTTDGSEPDLNNLNGTNFNYKNVYPLQVGSQFGPILSASFVSYEYNQAINVIDRSPLPDQLTTKNTSQSPIYIPPTPVRKGSVVKAKAFVNGIGSPTVAQTFFVWPQGNPYGLPIVSIIIPETSLFDYEQGIYTAGIDFDTWRLNNPDNPQYWRPEWNNYWRSGMEWEYSMHLEIFEPQDFTTLVSQKAGLRIHGNNSRSNPIKNLRLYARGMYDNQSEFDFPIFNQAIPNAPATNNTISKRILLRPDGSGGPVFYDVAFNTLMQPVYEGVTRIEHAVHFINGEFWGLTAFRDRFDAHHYSNNFGLSNDNIVQIDCKGANCGLDEGTNADYSEFIVFRDFINNNDMSDQNLFNQVEQQLDLRSFIDHMVLQIFSADNSYERFFWKAKVPENNNFGDGKWRVATQDFEAALSPGTNWLAHWSDVGIDPNSQMFAHLLANPSFKNDFINRFADLLNTAFLSSRFSEIIENIHADVLPYLLEDQHRYPRPNFYQNLEKQNLLDWANTSPDNQRANILSHFNIENTIPLTLNLSEVDAGKIKVNTVVIEPATPGVPQNPYPWNGLYFKNVPITLTAVANPGFVFSHWSGDVNSTDATIIFDPENSANITAHFTPIGLDLVTTYFWLMSNQITNDTPLTSLSSTYSVNQTTANLVYESCLVGYPFDNTHPLWRKASMERRNLPTPINYRPNANNFIAYEDANMRGIQIKQPFQQNGLENTLALEFSTLSMSDIQVSLACETDGAADELHFEYWDGQTWTNTGLPQSQYTIASGYQLIQVDFSDISAANNQALFRVRIRFSGSNLTEDAGKRVHFNNIAVDGIYGLGIEEIVQNPKLKLYPNPAQDAVFISSDSLIEEVTIGNVMGQILVNIAPNVMTKKLDLLELQSGVYWIHVRSGGAIQTLRLIKN